MEKPTLAAYTADIREKEIARSRSSFKLADFSYVEQDAIGAFSVHGITNTEQMPKEVSSTIQSARRLPSVVEYSKMD